MADAPEPPAAGADEPADAAPAADADEALGTPADTGTSARAPQRAGVRSLGWRTIAICAVVSLLVALVAAFVFVAIAGDDDPSTPNDQLDLTPGEGASAPEPGDVSVDALLGLRVFDADGEPTTLDQVRGDGRTLVNLWQSACQSCVREMPLLQAASEANPDVSFVGVKTQETDEAAATDLLERTGVAYPTVSDPEGNVYVATGLGGLPATVLLGPDGTVLATELGSFATADELQTFLDDHPA